jgi:hypothetical protein
MGLFDLFSKSKKPSSGEDKDLLRLQKMIANKLSQNVDREDALYRLGEMKTADSARVLLTRFNWTLNPSIKDQEEKEIAVNGIVAAGEAALAPIRSYCTRTEAITWPLKALRRLVSGAALEEELLSLLDDFDTDYMRNPEPKVQLVQVLGEFSSEDVRIAVQPFLTDLSEDVRFAAVTTVLGCELEQSTESLSSALVEEESLRVKNRIASGLASRAWVVPEATRKALASALPPGFQLSVEGSVTGQARS